jgi:uncharacterized protein (DUF1684 family)
MQKIFLFILLAIIIWSCSGQNNNAPKKYVKEINQWHKERVERLKQDNGWLNLVGLHWLEEGRNTFGSDESNDIVFPSKAPEFIGTYYLNDSKVSVNINEGVKVLADEAEVDSMQVKTDMSADPTLMENGTLNWYIIKRGDKYGIRLRDLEAELVKNFDGVDRFPIDTTWRVKAEYVPYNPPKTVKIPTIINTINEAKVNGKLVFDIKGNKYSIDPLPSGEGFFIIFADKTNGEETYGAGRFLYAEKPDSVGTTVLDFNKAYNPPCAFTNYATCPLPPKSNQLRVEITAGEKNYGEGH